MSMQDYEADLSRAEGAHLEQEEQEQEQEQEDNRHNNRTIEGRVQQLEETVYHMSVVILNITRHMCKHGWKGGE